MKTLRTSILYAAAVGVSVLALASEGDRAAGVIGDYVEARTCDVWTGPCFSNSEINLNGDHAVLAWRVDRGTHEGAELDGLLVVAAVDAEGTLGTEVEGKTRAVLYTDERASEQQARALVSMAKKLAPKYLANVVRIQVSPINYYRNGDHVVALEVGKAELKLKTAPLSAHCDTICGNEERAYGTLAETTKSNCAKSLSHLFKGTGLGAKWSEPNSRSAMVGTFEL